MLITKHPQNTNMNHDQASLDLNLKPEPIYNKL